MSRETDPDPETDPMLQNWEAGPKKHVVMIDLTPTWQGILPLLLAALEDGTDQGKQIAREELQRMAKAADAANGK